MTRHILAVALAAFLSGNCPGRGQPSKKSSISFDRVQAVKQVNSVNPGHTARNVLIGVGIALVAIGTVAGNGVMVAQK